MEIVFIALLAGLSGMLGWGISDFFAKKTIDRVGDLKTLIGSQVIGGFLLLLYFVLTGFSIPSITIKIFVYLVALAALDGAGYLLLYRAFEKGIMSIVSPIASSAAGFSVIVAIFLFRERLSITDFIGVVLIFLGILITSTDFNNLKGSLSRKTLSKGIPEALGVMILIGLWFPLWDRFVEGKEWLFWLILLKFVMSALLCLYFFFSHRGKSLLRGYKSVFFILIPVAFLDALAYLGTTWGYSVTSNTTSLITVLANAYSLPTIILAYFLLKERVSKTQLLGIGSILMGILVSSV